MKGDLAAQYREMHKKPYFTGKQTKRKSEVIGELIRDTGARTILDYGSGKGSAYINGRRSEWGEDVHITCYDPYYPPFSTKPLGVFGGVICVDVLEHIPEEDLASVLEEIDKHASRFVYLLIDTRPAKKNLPDGRNCHLTIRPREWWDNLVSEYFKNRLLRVEYD